jgi:glycosyltransferase involved in cell wall biosynthesis
MTARPNSALQRVTVILPCRNEASHISACLDSILASAHPAERLEVLVVDGMSDDGTRELIERYAATYPRIRMLDNPRRVVPTALNIGIRAATGDIIVRMDGHVVYPPEYIPRLVGALLEDNADNVGGCLITLPADGSSVAQAIAIAMAHPFGVGNAHFRIGAKEARDVDTVPFGCFRRSLFKRIGTRTWCAIRTTSSTIGSSAMGAASVWFPMWSATTTRAARCARPRGCFTSTARSNHWSRERSAAS